jgi:cyanophycinase-like exopeptidase
MTGIRDDLYRVVITHFDNPKELSREILFLAATTQIALGRTPDEASEAFHQDLAEVVRAVAQGLAGPLAQAVEDEA